MQNMTKSIVVATLIMASPMMADQRDNEKPGRTIRIESSATESSMRCSDGSRDATCPSQLAPIRITLASDQPGATKGKKMVQVPWMIGAFQ